MKKLTLFKALSLSLLHLPSFFAAFCVKRESTRKSDSCRPDRSGLYRSSCQLEIAQPQQSYHETKFSLSLPTPLSPHIFFSGRKKYEEAEKWFTLSFLRVSYTLSPFLALLQWLVSQGDQSLEKATHTLFSPLFISNNQSKTLKKTAIESPFTTIPLHCTSIFFTFTLLIREKVMITIMIMIIIITSHQPRIFNTSHVKNNTAISAIKIIPITFSC